jgi:AcrR family transcriptional regulator
MEPATRERLLETVLVELGGRGRQQIDPGQALAAAGVSRADFEAEYGGLEACLNEAYEQLTRRLDGAVRAGCGLGAAASGEAAGDWPGRVRRGLEALLAELAAEPGLARALVRGFPSLGPREQARYQAFVESFGPMLAEGRGCAETAEELPREVEALAVGGAEAIVFEEIEAGRADQLPAMTPSILFSILVPFLGPERAAEEMEKARRQS